MTQYIEDPVLKHIESLFEMELRLLRSLVDTGGFSQMPEEPVCCYFLSDDQEALHILIHNVRHLGDE